MLRLILPLLITTIGTVGCQSIPTVGTSLNQDRVILDQVNEKARGKPDWFIQSQKASLRLGETYRGEIEPKMAWYLENDFYFFQNIRLQEYLQGIADRLLAAWEGPGLNISIVVETGPEFTAYVDEYNLLHVSTGMLRQLENEDQVAAVFAHELSHILLRHNSEKRLSNNMITAIQWGTMGSALYAGHKAKKTGNDKYLKKGEHNFYRFQSLGMIWGDLLAPHWSRQNEGEADRLGLDLLMRADYNYEEFPGVIEKIHDAAIRHSERTQLLSEVADALIDEHSAEVYEATTDRYGERFGKIIGKFAISATKTLKEISVTKLAEVSSKTHQDRADRIDTLKRYLNTAHDGGDLPPDISRSQFQRVVKHSLSPALRQDAFAVETLNFVNARNNSGARSSVLKLGGRTSDSPISAELARATVDLMNGRNQSAAGKLRSLTRNPNAPVEAYLKLADAYLQSKQYNQAEHTLQTGINRIGRDYRFLPVLIEVNKRQKNVLKAEEYALKCQKYEKEEKGRLAQSLGSLGLGKSEGTYYKTCTRKLGYDVIAKREKEREERSKQRSEDFKKAINTKSDELTEKFGNSIKSLFQK